MQENSLCHWQLVSSFRILYVSFLIPSSTHERAHGSLTGARLCWARIHWQSFDLKWRHHCHWDTGLCGLCVESLQCRTLCKRGGWWKRTTSPRCGCGLVLAFSKVWGCCVFEIPVLLVGSCTDGDWQLTQACWLSFRHKDLCDVRESNLIFLISNVIRLSWLIFDRNPGQKVGDVWVHPRASST